MALSALRGIRRGSLFPKVQDFTRDLWYAHSDRDLPYFSAHDLRHLHASRLLHDGLISPAQIAARLGAEVTMAPPHALQPGARRARA